MTDKPYSQSMATKRELLDLGKRTRQRLTPGSWTQGDYTNDRGQHCMLGAMSCATGGCSFHYPSHASVRASAVSDELIHSFWTTYGVPPSSVVSINDAQGYEAVMKLLDEAIASLEKQVEREELQAEVEAILRESLSPADDDAEESDSAADTEPAELLVPVLG